MLDTQTFLRIHLILAREVYLQAGDWLGLLSSISLAAISFHESILALFYSSCSFSIGVLLALLPTSLTDTSLLLPN